MSHKISTDHKHKLNAHREKSGRFRLSEQATRAVPHETGTYRPQFVLQERPVFTVMAFKM